MKKLLLISLAFMIGFAVVAQHAKLKSGVFVKNLKKEQPVTVEPLEKPASAVVSSNHSGLKNSDNPNIVTIIELGSSSNVLGYSSGSRPMVWADDDLNCVINLHRAGPPTSLSGYYAMDLGINRGQSEFDWNSQIIVQNSTLVATPYYYDASRYPCAGIYNPTGNTSMANAYCTWFGPNFANLQASGFGGYTRGRANLANFTDTTKRIRWFDAMPPTYIPDGYAVTHTGVVHVLDGGTDIINSIYIDSVVYSRGVWNSTSKDFDFTIQTIPFPCVEAYGTADCKIAASEDGNTVWMSVLTNLVGATPLIDSTYFPALRKSTDGGLTWGPPIPIQLDGPHGLAAVKNAYSDYFIANFFADPLPTRDEIPYTTAFDHSLSVDKWGNPHIGVVIGYAPGGYSISTGVDSLLNAFDIYSIDGGATFQAVQVGSISTFRGTWATYTSDNRMYISRNKAGDHMFFTWNDTKIEGTTDNQNPDVYARGFDLVKKQLTSFNGENTPNNVTFLSDCSAEAYWQCTSPIVFTDDNKFTLPICFQWFIDAAGSSVFKYIPDFSYTDAEFTINVPNPGVGVDQKTKEAVSVNVYPNPVKDIAKVSVNLSRSASVIINVTNLVGNQVMSLNKGTVNAGSQQFSVDASNLASGIYFITVNVNGQKYTQKMIVE